MDLSSLRDAKPTDLLAAADAYQTLDTSFGTHAQSWKTGTADRVHSSDWSGPTADAALPSIDATTSKLQSASMELSFISRVLRDGAEAFMLAQSQLAQALADAKAQNLTVDEAGRVSWTSEPSGAENSQPDEGQLKQQHAQDISDRINKALADATDADLTTAQRLQHYTDNAISKAGLDLGTAYSDFNASIDPFSNPSLMASRFPAANASPRQVSAWWNGLTPDEQKRLLADYPDQLGNRDGIPSDVRDQANRANLPKLIQQYQSMPQPLSPADQQKLDGFKAIQQKVQQGDDDAALGKGPKPYLLGVSADGQGRGILSYGDPDTADNVSAYVPGVGTTLSNAGGKDADRARNVYDSASSAAPGQSTASIVWLGYDAPPAASADSAGDIASAERAKVGAVSYDQFLDGLRTTHQGQPAHVTAIGHSYGSLLVGQAAQRPGGIPADDVVLVGSPGTGADSASQLSVGAGHVYVGGAMVDPVTRTPSPGEVIGDGVVGGLVGGVVGGPLAPITIPIGAVTGAVTGHTITGSDDGWFGKDPASAAFGAQRFKVADGDISDPFAAHSEYFDKDPNGPSESLYNIGRIVAGHGDQIDREEGR
ncbi:alpha/beta hydrolase [Kitasatospora sp. NPDC008050]|uniref:alpha/beta hydrolase n=1 Tax=Kitasatospora sp. NPDC008050 TaxID=3364021 RepID=UPI0036E3E048